MGHFYKSQILLSIEFGWNEGVRQKWFTCYGQNYMILKMQIILKTTREFLLTEKGRIRNDHKISQR